MIRINLLPVRAALKKEKLHSQLSILILCIILVCIGCGALYVQQKITNNNIKDEIVAIEQKNKELKNKIGQVKDYEKKKVDLEQKLGILKTLKDGKSGPVHLLDELSAALPEKIWLTKFSEKNGSIKLVGVADSEKTVAVFMRSLDISSYYKNIELSVTEQTKVGDRKMQKFALNCKVETLPSK
jgi:type IV pilus assembly protein PilN